MSFDKNNPISPKYHPSLNGTKCSWLLPVEFSENNGFALLGMLQDLLSKPEVEYVFIDLQNIHWVDPQPLLCLGLVIAESKLKKDNIILNLCSMEKDEDVSAVKHRKFLKFFAEQGFLAAFNDYMIFCFDGKYQYNFQDLFLNLTSVPEQTHFLHADCIRARIISTELFRIEKNVLQVEIEKILNDAKDLSSKTAFGSDPVARDILFQKLRKILYEIILNVAEHSHMRGTKSYAGIYARIREAKPPVESEATVWTELFEKTISTFGQRDFSPNPYAEWLELFICDIGRGLTFHIKDWILSESHKDYKNLVKAKNSKNPFMSLVHRFFRAGFSRYSRHDSERTAVTGLQHLGHLLSLGGDYCRIYTQKGSWAGGHYPWSDGYIPSFRDISDTTQNINKIYKGLNPISGTAYSFYIQPDHRNLLETPTVWEIPDESDRKKIINSLKTQMVILPNVAVIYDMCDENSCLPPKIDESIPPSSKVAVLRPSKLFNKRELGKWIEMITGDLSSIPKLPVTFFVIADLSPFQSLTFNELLLNIYVQKEVQLDLYLVAKNWAVSCVTTEQGSSKFVLSNEKAKNFLNQKITIPFYAADLAVLLRQMDSKIFWKLGTGNVPSPFFNHPVDWLASRDKTKPIRLQRYIDFPLALIDPNRYQACLRSLSRCIALYPEYNAIGADDLVSSLVRDAKLNSYISSDKMGKNNIVIGSITVTAGTVNRLKKNNNDESIQILIHDDAKNGLETTSLSALLWISQLPDENSQETSITTDTQRPWMRILNTPHISPLGEKSISILRYNRNTEGMLDFDKPLYYGRTPDEMYNDFQRLGILKTGHWMYSNRHDLLTINMRQAFQYSFIELGPLYFWLKKQFDFFFNFGNNIGPLAQLLVYPSHPVTDNMLDRIRQDPSFADILPEGGMIPIKFLGQSTVSPLLASHLVEYRISHLIKKFGWTSWSAVIFDDGTISGKHLREIAQFLQGLGGTYYTVALLDRSGLPAQEKVFKKFDSRHKRFWRWDVPGLGNKRNCPLCQALSIIQTYAHKLSSERQKKRLNEWTEIWKVRNVDLEWHKGAMPKTSLSPPLKITFGVDEDDKGERKEKSIVLGSSHAAASLLIELTRLTTRADVTIKKADIIVEGHPDAAIELIASQLLLFIDELGPQEKIERYKKLLNIIWNRTDETEATALVGLCFTLIDNDILEDILDFCSNELLPKHRLGNLDATIATNILLSKYEFNSKIQYQLPICIAEEGKLNCIMLSTGLGFKHAISSFLINLYRHPSNENHLCAHSTEIKKRLFNFTETTCDQHAEKVILKEIIQDMELIEEILRNFLANLIITRQISNFEYFITIISNLKKSNPQSEKGLILKNTKLLQELLYGENRNDGIVTEVGNKIFKQFKNSDEFDNKFIAVLVRNMLNRWIDIIESKQTDKRNSIVVKRWRNENGEIIKPIIICSENDKLQNIWVYIDSFIKGIIEDALSNVFHACSLITDQFQFNDIKSGNDQKAHLWWRIEIDNNYCMMTMVNATENQKIVLRQNANIARLEHAGGRIESNFKSGDENLIVYTTIYIPLHSHFIKEE